MVGNGSQEPADEGCCALGAPGGLTLACLGAAAGVKYAKTAGVRSSRFRAKGKDEYSVVAKRMAAQLRRKSVKHAASVYGMKKRCRDCKTDQSKTATYSLILSVA